MSTFIPKLQKGPYHTELKGAELCAFQAVAGKLLGAAGAEQGRQLWSNLTTAVHGLTDQIEAKEDKAEACKSFFNDTRNALHSTIIARKLAEGGYGDFDQLITNPKGEQQFDVRSEAGKRASAVYGTKMKFRSTLEKAETTLKQYEANILSAIEFDVSFVGTGLSKLNAEVKAARDAADPARVKARELDNWVSATGSDLASSFKRLSDDRQAVGVYNAFGVITRVWEHLDDQVRDHLAEVLNLTAAIAAEVQAELDAKAQEKPQNGDTPVLEPMSTSAEAVAAPAAKAA